MLSINVTNVLKLLYIKIQILISNITNFLLQRISLLNIHFKNVKNIPCRRFVDYNLLHDYYFENLTRKFFKNAWFT